MKKDKTSQPEQTKNLGGRPAKYNRNEVMDRVYEILATSERGIAHILTNELGMPGITVFYEWLEQDTELAKKYARAKELQAEYSEGMLLQIADDGRNDFMETEKGDKFNGEHVSRSKLRIEARQWLMGKLRPKKYGSKTEHEVYGKDGGAIQTENLNIDMTNMSKEDLLKLKEARTVIDKLNKDVT